MELKKFYKTLLIQIKKTKKGSNYTITKIIKQTKLFLFYVFNLSFEVSTIQQYRSKISQIL
jgi:hypothetical protein